jgi:Fur family transcriptional regulator, peroxide stress response regulator
MFISEPMSPAEKQQRIERFFSAHRECGFPVTTQRRAVFEAIQDRTDHPTAEQLYRAVRVRLPQVSRMTVHRILGTFVSLGLVAKTCHLGSAARFDPKLHQHHHLVCLKCGRIVDIEDPLLNRMPWPKVKGQKFEIQDYSIDFRGHCDRCREKTRARNGKPTAKSGSRALTTAK